MEIDYGIIYKRYRPYIRKGHLNFNENIMDFYERDDDPEAKFVIFSKKNTIELGFLYPSIEKIHEKNNYCLREFLLDDKKREVILKSQVLINNINIKGNKINYRQNCFPEYKILKLCTISEILEIKNEMVNKIDNVFNHTNLKYEIKEFCINNKNLFFQVIISHDDKEIIKILNNLINNKIWEDGMKIKINDKI